MLSIKKSALPAFGLLFALNCTAQTRLYVAAAATGANDGSSWADAFPDLQSALQIAQAGDTVWVATGIYKPSIDDRTISFVQPSDVRLYGGFAGTETGLDQRDWAANVTVLSGDIGVTGDSTDNTYNIVYMPYPDSNTVFDGFTLRDGVAGYTGPTTSTDRRKCGAGLYIMAEDGDAYPVIRNCRFERNTARLSGGGALVNATGEGSAAPCFFNCAFVDNAAQNGGGLARLGGSWVEQPADLDSSVFLGNRASVRGGGFYYSDSERSDQLDVRRCRFEKNTAVMDGGGIFAFFGREAGAEFDLYGTLFQENQVDKGSVALKLFTGSVMYTKSVCIQDCGFEKNKNLAMTGTSNDIVGLSLIGTENAVLLLDKNSFTKNTQMNGNIFSCSMEFCTVYACGNTFMANISTPPFAVSVFVISGKGSHINKNKFQKNVNIHTVIRLSLNDPVVGISNCDITDNDFNPDEGRYLAISTDKDSLIWTNCVISNNIHDATPEYGEPKYISIKNCTFSGIPANNGPGENSFWESSVNTYISHSHLGDLDCSDLPAPVTCGPGILTGIDPLFVAPDSGDYRLQPCSPLVNAGDNAGLDTQMTDLAGQPRIQSDIVDIGAYETPPPQLAAAPAVTPSCPGGFTGAVAFQPEQGCEPYQYAWTSGAASGQGATQLAPGDYVFTVSDARGSYFSVALSVPGDGPSFDLTAQAMPVVCGDTLGGSTAASPSGGAPPYAYAWAGGGADSVLAGLLAGSYAVTVTDAAGCTATGAAEVTLSGVLALEIDVQEISCPGAADGAFVVLPANGQAPFVWQWADGSSGPAYGPLGPGVFTGTLTDALGCSIGWVLPLEDPQPIAFDTGTTPASGPAAADGSATADDLAGGHPPFQIAWSNGDTGFLADSLLPGLHTVTVTDANGCQAVQTVEVSFVSGVGQAPGALPALALWPNPAAGSFLLQTDPRFVMRQVEVTDLNGRAVRAFQNVNASRFRVNCAGLAPGVYFVRVAFQEGAITRRVILTP